MKLVILSGSSCSGKSTIIKELLKQKERYFYLSHDSLKWSFSQYSSGKYYEDIHKLKLCILEAVCELKYNVITEAVGKISRQKHIDIAKIFGYEIVEINIEADWEILSKRFDERIANALANPEIKISNTSKERFKEIYNKFQSEKNPTVVSFRTDIQSIGEITKAILKLL